MKAVSACFLFKRIMGTFAYKENNMNNFVYWGRSLVTDNKAKFIAIL